MENKKCILFVRVSTSFQSLTEQEKELHQMAINDGYSKENIILIPEKESGIKLSEEERKGITTLKKHIENDDTINCVYLWEISRLARRQKVLMSIREYLIERKINIKIKTPTCSLLNADGTLNEGADLIFSLYSQMSEAEMRTKIERFRRTKKVNSEKRSFPSVCVTARLQACGTKTPLFFVFQAPLSRSIIIISLIPTDEIKFFIIIIHYTKQLFL